MPSRKSGPLGAFLLILPLLLGNTECSRTTGAQRESQLTEQLQSQASLEVGMPGIQNFTEKRLLKMLYEMRDNPDLVTWTYTLDMNGKRHPVCPTSSVGYGIPYATQYTAGQGMQRWYDRGGAGGWTATWGHEKMPQAEPNGLYPPVAAEGTWIICLAPDGKRSAPVYVEPRVEVYQWEMPHATD